VSIPFSSQDSRALTVGVQSIIATNVNNGTASMTTKGGHLSLIDSTVSQLWLPPDVCDQFAGNLNLTYDNITNLYLLSPSAHSNLKALNPSFTFKIGQTSYDNGVGVSIVFPYSAFDLTIGWPIYNETVPYFPIRQAANDSQYTLGRAFLQEAYIIVDYGRKNFTVAPAAFPDTTVNEHIVAIPNIFGSGGKSGLSTGAIAGVVIGAIVALTIAIIGLLWCIRRRRKESKPAKIVELDAKESGMAAQYSKVPGLVEADGDQVIEMPASYESYNKVEASELETPAPIYEMEGDGSTLSPGRTPSFGGRTPTPQTNTSGRRSTPFSPASDQYSPAQPSPMSKRAYSPDDIA
jgi:hypothetical protein